MKFLDCMLRAMDKFGLEKGKQPTDALFYVLEGGFDLTVNGQTVSIKPNDLVAFPKDISFQRHITSQLKFYYVKAVFEGALPCGILPVKNKIRLLSNFAFMLEATKKNKELAEHFLNDIFMQIKAEELLDSEPKKPLIEEIIQFFKENLNKNITLELLANKFGVSKSGLIENFKNSTGMTPMRYLANLRLKEAEELLVTGDLSLSEIADFCGYDNAFYFSNIFKKAMGESPKFYREKHRI